MNQDNSSKYKARSFRRVGAVKEAFKFSLYILIPIMASFVYSDLDVMHNLIKQWSFVKFPARPELDEDKLKSQQDISEKGTKFREFIKQQKDSMRNNSNNNNKNDG